MMRQMLIAVAALAIGATAAPSRAADNGQTKAVPALAFTDYAWLKRSDDFLPPESGPGPVLSDRAHPYVANNDEGRQPTFRVADLTNPILKPWAAAQMKTANDEVLAGGIPFIARSSCVPGGVPGFLVYARLEPMYFIQTPKEVLIIVQGNAEARHVYMDVPHAKNPKSSWYGESVGHYENGDTLVVDTIGMNDKTFLDNYRTPHTTALHVVERFKVIDGGQKLDVAIHVEDPGTFNSPWNARQEYRRAKQGAMQETPCAENKGYFGVEDYSIPQAGRPDF